MMKQVDLEKILATFRWEIQNRPNGKMYERREAKTKLLGALKGDIIAHRDRGSTLRAISDSIAAASGGLLGIRDVRAALAVWERRSNKLGRPKKSGIRKRPGQPCTCPDASQTVGMPTEKELAHIQHETEAQPEQQSPVEKEYEGMEELENPFPLLPEEDERYVQSDFFDDQA